MKFLNLNTSAKSKFIDTAQKWGKNVLSEAQRLFNRLVKSGNYDLRAEIDKNVWNKAENGGYLAKEWFVKQIAVNKQYHIQRQYMEPGRLYIFRYMHPKYENILDFYDTQPLVLALPRYISNEGNVVEQGINLHLLPQGARIDLLCAIFDLFRNEYAGEMYRAKQAPIRSMTWQRMKKLVHQYGGEFAFRAYVPELKTGTIQFPYETFPKAIFLPSLQYEKKSADDILALYMQYLYDIKIPYRPTNLRMF